MPLNSIGREFALRQLKAMIHADAVNTTSYIDQMRGESDRGAIILAATLIDDALKVALERALNGLNSDERARMFDYKGALGGFSSRITMVKALKLIPRKHAGEIEIIKEMRNVAAHAHLDVTFDTPQVRQAPSGSPRFRRGALHSFSSQSKHATVH